MREIKFRAWLKHAKTMLPNDRIAVYLRDVVSDDMVHYMQYTGLTDKNGTEIYEGDIVIFKNHAYLVMIYFNGCQFQAYKMRDGELVKSYRYSMSLITKPSKDGFSGVVGQVEVLGNIHENPDLLTLPVQP